MQKSTVEECNYCGEENVSLDFGCCEKCHWEMYISELSELVAQEEQESKKIDNKHNNP